MKKPTRWFWINQYGRGLTKKARAYLSYRIKYSKRIKKYKSQRLTKRGPREIRKGVYVYKRPGLNVSKFRKEFKSFPSAKIKSSVYFKVVSSQGFVKEGWSHSKLFNLKNVTDKMLLNSAKSQFIGLYHVQSGDTWIIRSSYSNIYVKK